MVWKPKWSRPWLGWMAAGLAAVGGTLGLWAFWWEPSGLKVNEYELHIAEWPAACEGLRIAVLADLHVGSPYNGLGKLERIVDETLAARPDLILLTGDYVIDKVIGGRRVSPEAIAGGLSRLTAPLGVFAVLGNHEWDDDPARIKKAFKFAGLSLLDGESRHITADECAFWLTGLMDLWNSNPRALARTLAAVDPQEGPIVAFTHNPDVFAELPRPVALTIAGHTHGGQVNFPLIGRPVIPSLYGQRYAIGHIVEDGRHLFVSSGLGTCFLPVRFRVPPEISILVVHSTERVISGLQSETTEISNP